MRIIGLDIGNARTGIAVSDELGITAQGVKSLKMVSWNRDADEICAVCRVYGTDRVVAGLPLNMDGSEGAKAQEIREFCKRLTDRGLQVRFADERLTTVKVTRTLLEADVRRDKRKDVVDMLAAQEILQGFMDAGGWRENLNDPGNAEDAEYYRGVFYMADDKRKRFDDNFEGEENGMIEEDDMIREVTLVDEDGAEVKFEHLLTVEHKGHEYICLAPLEATEDIGDDEVVILRIDQDDAGNDVYVTIDDDEELDDVFEKYCEIAEADEDNE